MNRSTRPSSGWALSADGKEIAKRTASALLPCPWLASTASDEAPTTAITQPAASVERIGRRPPGFARRAVRAHTLSRGGGARIGDGILGRMASSYDCDVLVAGGGPAGSAAAAVLAPARGRVVLLRREQLSRFYICDALLASAYDGMPGPGAVEHDLGARLPDE